MNDVWTSIIRTLTPMLAGFLVTAALKLGIDLDDATATQAVAVGLGALWYVAARALEQWKPGWGWLLGAPKQPTYPKEG